MLNHFNKSLCGSEIASRSFFFFFFFLIGLNYIGSGHINY